MCAHIVVEDQTPKCKPICHSFLGVEANRAKWPEFCSHLSSLYASAEIESLYSKVEVSMANSTLMTPEPIVSLAQSFPFLTLPGFRLALLAIPSTHPV